MLTIGFTNKYYTLWNVSAPYKHYTSEYNYVIKVDKIYSRNLSMNLEEAKKKVEKLVDGGEYVVDLTLCGECGWNFSETINEGTDRPYWQFPTGRLEGVDIRTCEDVAALWHMYLKKDIWNNGTVFQIFDKSSDQPFRGGTYSNRESAQDEIDYQVKYDTDLELEIKEVPSSRTFKDINPHWVKPCALARRRLVELGVIVKHDGQYMTPEYIEKYEAKKAFESAKTGHFFENGQRVDVRLKEVKDFSFETRYGTTYVVIYVSDDNKVFKYMGSSPKWFGDEGFVNIKATVKHDNYKGEDETKLQRIKILD